MVRRLLLLLVICSAGFIDLYAQDSLPRLADSRDMSILINTKINTNPPSITLSWDTLPLAKSLFVYRKTPEATKWGDQIAILDSGTSSFTDTNVEAGKFYEYKISSRSTATFMSFKTDSLGNIIGEVYYPMDYYAFGYTVAGIDAGPLPLPGKVLLLVDNTLEASIEKELEDYEAQLRCEGWQVARYTAPRAEKFDTNAIKTTKDIILSEYYSMPQILRAVVLIGRIAVPYSGDYAPDSHGDHRGAWPADSYYGSLWAPNWTDNSVNDSSASRIENKNLPGDGKFDQSYITNPGTKIQIGRIDFYRLPSFSESEAGLMKAYFKKNLDFRTGKEEMPYTSFINDSFPTFYYKEGYASSGWRNFASLLGYENIKKGDWQKEIYNERFLWAYGCGSGYYNFAAGVGHTWDLAANPINATFTLLFGSFLGDWDSEDNLMRGILASDPSVLTCAWGGRPPWFIHHMGIGQNIGYSALLSQNNRETYNASAIYLYGPDSTLLNYDFYRLGVHSALMGDPTLNMYSRLIPAPKNLTIIKNEGKISLSWDKPDNSEGLLYNIYRATSSIDSYTLVGDKLQTTTFEENTPDSTVRQYTYLVRPVKLMEKNSGRIYYEGIGIIDSILFTSVRVDDKIAYFNLSPNPFTEDITLEINLTEDNLTIFSITDVRGSIIISKELGYLRKGENRISIDISNNNNVYITPGIYFGIIKSGKNVFTRKLIKVNKY